MKRDGDRHIEDEIQKLLDGELTPGQAEEVREHAETCERCGKTLADLRAVYEAIQADRGPRPLKSMWPAVRKGLAPASIPRFDFSFGLATSAAAAAGVVLGLLLGSPHGLLRYSEEDSGMYDAGSYLGEDSVPTLDEVYVYSFEEDGEGQ